MTSNSQDIETALEGSKSSESQQYATLIAAIAAGDVAAVEEVLKQAGAGVSALLERKNNDDWTPLMHAVEADNTEIVDLLAQHGACVDPLYQPGTTPLFRAAAVLRSMDMVRVLVQHGANMDFRLSKNSESIVMKSIPFGGENSEIALYLIAQGAACGEDVKSGRSTAASLACTYDNPEVFLALLKASALTGSDKTPLQYAAEEGSVPVVEACLADPVLCAPAEDSQNAELIRNALGDEVRQAIFSWRSERAIAAAFPDDDAGCVAMPKLDKGMSL